MDSSVETWWITLSIISLINIIAWFVSAYIFSVNNRKQKININILKWRKVMIWCSGIYTFVCAFRSILPRIDLERICLVDTVFSNIFIGRSVATVAEIAFIVQCAILLHEAGRGVGDRLAIAVSISLVPIIVVAEGFSWFAMLTTNYFGSVIEESLWTVCGILLLISFFWIWPHVKNRHKNFLNVMIVFAIGFVLFMINIDVPMYYTRWTSDTLAGIHYFTLYDGVIDSLTNYRVNFSGEVWGDEFAWMTLYFTAAVWVSIVLPLAPNYKQVIKKSSRKRAKQSAANTSF